MRRQAEGDRVRWGACLKFSPPQYVPEQGTGKISGRLLEAEETEADAAKNLGYQKKRKTDGRF